MLLASVPVTVANTPPAAGGLVAALQDFDEVLVLQPRTCRGTETDGSFPARHGRCQESFVRHSFDGINKISSQ